MYTLAQTALERGETLAQTVAQFLSDTTVDYEPIYALESGWRLLPPITHPEPSRCLVTGTGLTHKASADNRAAMHKRQAAELSDSERMYVSGVKGGHPGPGEIGVAPEWFYKGCGTNVRAHGQPLLVPAHAEDGGEEPEIAGIYFIDAEGRPRRVGMTMANEFSDHVLEKRNYLYLAASKMRTCSLGPELVLDPDFSDVRGDVSIERDGNVLWSHPIASGEVNMSHSLANLEHHHFKYEIHRRPGDVHVHLFGADAFSFGAGIRLQDGDVMAIAFDGFGRPLRNPVRIEREPQRHIAVEPL